MTALESVYNGLYPGCVTGVKSAAGPAKDGSKKNRRASILPNTDKMDKRDQNGEFLVPKPQKPKPVSISSYLITFLYLSLI